MIEFREPPRTGFEFGWRMFGIRFRIMPTFFLIAAVFAYVFVGPNLVAIALDVACIFVAISITLFIQAVVYRSYGLRSSILVQDFGGGVYPEGQPPTMLQRIIVNLASPASSFMLLALVIYSNQEFGWRDKNDYTKFAFAILRIICLVWGILGLIPIFPYAMGRVLGEILTALSPRSGLIATLAISIAVALAYVAYTIAVWTGNLQAIILQEGVPLPANPFAAVFFGITIFRNFELIQMVRAQSRPYEADDYGERAPWER